MRIKGLKSEFYDKLTWSEKAHALALINVVVGFLAGITAILF